MHLQIERHEREGIVILDLKGRFVLGPEDALVREEIQSLCTQRTCNVVVHFKNVTRIDTAAIGTLVVSAEKLRTQGGRLALANLSPDLLNMANILKLDSDLAMYPTELDAVNSFFPDRAVSRYDILQLVERVKAQRATESNPELKK
jgi:anti-sigma B factor antagonist